MPKAKVSLWERLMDKYHMLSKYPFHNIIRFEGIKCLLLREHYFQEKNINNKIMLHISKIKKRMVILFIQKTSKSIGSCRKLCDVLILSIVFLIIISQSFIVIITEGQSIETLYEKIANNDLNTYSTYQNRSIQIPFRLIGFISNPRILHSDPNEKIYSLQFNAERVYCTTIEPPSYTHGAYIKNKIYDAQQTIIIPITTYFTFDSIPISFIGPGAFIFCTNHFIFAKSPFYSINYLFTLFLVDGMHFIQILK